MIQRLKTPVSATLVFDHTKRSVFPREVIWQGRAYSVVKVGLHHTYRTGRTLYHVFSVQTPGLFLRLVFNTDNLHWTLEEISDGLPD